VAALREGRVSAYASVAMAHRGMLARSPDTALAISDLGDGHLQSSAGGEPALGAYSFSKANESFAASFDAALGRFLGSAEHLQIMTRYGFSVVAAVARG
jgi:polar amino acid transport system substrate-binding protein